MSVDSLFTKIVCPPCTPVIAAKFFTNKQKVFKGHSPKGLLNMASQSYGRQNLASPNEIQQRLNQKRQMQQFYLHKLFDLLLDAEFLPLIPSDPVVAAIQMQETYAMNNATNNLSRYQPQNGSPAMPRQDMPFYGASQKARRHSGQFLHQHLFGGKRPDYAQYRSN